MISRSMHFAQILPGRGPFSRIRRKRDAYGAILASQGPVAAATRGTGTRAACGGRNADGARGTMGAVPMRTGRGGMGAIWAGPQRTTPTMILDLLDTGTARREWRRGSAQAMGLSKRGRRNGAETEGHAGAWAQWSRAARCRRCDEGQCSAEIAVGAGGAVGAGPGLGWRWSGPGGAGKRASVDAMHRRGRQLFAQAGKHRRNALLQRFDELLVHFEHLLQIGRRSIFPRDSPC